MGSDDKCWLKPEQVKAMRAAARDGRHLLWDDALIVLLYDTGFRRAELSQVGRAILLLADGDDLTRIKGAGTRYPLVVRGSPSGRRPRATPRAFRTG